MVRVNCASIPRELYESKFFGHIKGAFTGAVRDRVGRFELANKGTLFLDEIGEIPLDLQSKLLRVLQEGTFERVGDEKTRHVDVRIIAASNRDLKAEVERGNFREDLFYRLNVFPINVPPLRQRKEDTPLLAAYLLRLAAKKFKTDEPRLSKANVLQLTNYDWPGNVRELKNTISFAAIHCKGPVISAKDLPPEITGAPARHSLRREYAVDTEKDRIMKALEACGGNRGEAAKMLGIGRATLYRRMKACMIKPSDLPRGAGWKQ